jgi:anti-sigma factor RsiW
MNCARHGVVDDCLRFSMSIAPFVDGELDADHAVDVESHLASCTDCKERVALVRATRVSLRRTAVRVSPPQLRTKVLAAMERSRVGAAAGAPVSGRRPSRLIGLRYAVSLAAAAGVVFAMGTSRYVRTRDAATEAASVGGEAVPNVGIDALLEELVALHARPFPPDTTDPDQLPRFDPLVGVQIHRPMFQPFGASFQGARVHAVADRGALLQLQYTVGDGRRVTMYVFNPRVVPVQGSRLEPRMVRHRSILMGQLGGYSVAAAEQSGVGYAFASDLDPDESTKMVLAALQQ